MIANGGTTLDVILENEFWSHVYGSASRGDPAVVETMNGRPALIATPAGTLSGPADPRVPLAIVWVFIPIGLLLLFGAIRGRLR